MKVFAIVFLVLAVSFVTARPQSDVHSAIIGVFNSAVPTFSVNPVPVAQPVVANPNAPGAIAAFASAQHSQGPAGTGFQAQTAILG